VSYVTGVLAPGTTVAGYTVETLIGRGGMGAVYRASEEGLGRKVALKVIAPELAQDERFRERFLRESRIAASLDHPHVIPIYQAGEDRGLLFLAMRYVEGTDLARVVAEDGALEPKRAVDLLSQVAEALDAAHEKGLVHRDVKPSNVLIAKAAGREHCYLGDFGLTKRTGSLSGVTAAGEIVGTLEYVAPEQITGDPLDERSDVYSLGCVLYECLTGQAPFPRATDVALLWAHVHEEPTPPSKARPELPKELDTVLARALAKEPGRRYRSAGELVAATRSALRLGDVPVSAATRSSTRIGIAIAIAVLAIAAIGAFVFTRDSGGLSTAPNSVVALDESGAIAATVPAGARPVALASAGGALWVANLDDQNVTRIDVSSRRAVRTIPIGEAPTALAATRSAVWVTDGAGAVSKIDPRYDRLTFTRPLAASGSFFGGTVRPTLAAFGSIWVVDPDGFVSRIDRRSGRKTGSVGVGNLPSAIAAGAGSVWVTNSSDGTVTRIDSTTLVPKTIPVGHSPSGVAVNAAGAWIANAGDNTVVRVDTGTNAVTGTTPVGDGPTAVFATPTALWVANGRDGTVMRLDPRTGEVNKTIRLGGTPTAFATAAGQIWVAVAPVPPQSPPAGGVARLTTHFDFTTLDPALCAGCSGQVLYATCANLVTYPDKPAPEGSRIVPEVAEAVPAPTAGGTTYTFRIRRGFRFSPPSNEPVTAMTFKSTIERVTNPRMKSQLANLWFGGVVGYEAYATGTARGLSGVVARGRKLTIRLRQPDGAFLANLAAGSACAVPRETPADADGINDLPSAGPYYIASYTPRQQLVLRRNPNYHGDRPHRLDEIVVAIGVDPSRALEEIEAGTADYAFELPRDAGPRLQSAYGPGSKAAKEGHQQYFVSAALGVRYLHMNTIRPLFSDVRMRRAVNYAIDRPALVAQGQRFLEINPFNAGEPTDDYIPPSVAGATDFHLYPVNGPDLQRAKRLAGRVHATAILYTPNTSPWVEEAQIIHRNLEPLGIDVQVKEFAIGDFFARVTRRGEPFDLAVSGYALSPDPGDILSIFDSSTNISHFADPGFDRKLKAVAKLSGAKRYRAASRLALELERDAVPAAAIAWNTSRDFFSARIGCQVYQPFYGMDLAALCLRE
jgi:YVTN family beta-propeller protein